MSSASVYKYRVIYTRKQNLVSVIVTFWNIDVIIILFSTLIFLYDAPHIRILCNKERETKNSSTLKNEIRSVNYKEQTIILLLLNVLLFVSATCSYNKYGSTFYNVYDLLM